MKRTAPPLNESEFPREEPRPLGRKKVLDDGSVAPICGGSRAERARARRNPRVEIRGRGCDSRRGRSQGGGGGGEHGGLRDFSGDLRDS
jgi:hypothetical protein